MKRDDITSSDWKCSDIISVTRTYIHTIHTHCTLHIHIYIYIHKYIYIHIRTKQYRSYTLRIENIEKKCKMNQLCNGICMPKIHKNTKFTKGKLFLMFAIHLELSPFFSVGRVLGDDLKIQILRYGTHYLFINK